MFTSYAQNFEDVMLWRALKHVKNGFYIDIGAQDPVVDSVSLGFYEQGWRGVHVEPTAAFAEALRLARPDETVFQAAISASEAKSIRLFEIPDSGLSTGNSAVAERHRSKGWVIHEREVSSLSLSSILERYKSREIHWLKIDVEGMEASVIESWMQSTVRPWILVVESTLPNSQIAAFEAWDPNLRGLGYKFVYFDGLNRFYVSLSQPELEAAFLSPPNVFDEYTLSGSANNSLCSRLNKKNDSIQLEVNQLQALVSTKSGEFEELQVKQQVAEADLHGVRLENLALIQDAQRSEQVFSRQLSERDRMIALAQGNMERFRKEVQGREREAEHKREILQLELAALHSSTSWKLTRPLRFFGVDAELGKDFASNGAKTAGSNPKIRSLNESHRLRDLLLHDGPDFVENAYRTILRRDADPAGRSFYLKRLQGGSSKIGILGDLRYSAEGRTLGTAISGLEFQYRLQRLSRRPILGAILRFVMRLFLPSRSRPSYVLDELLSFRGAEFISQSYKAVLSRPPDSDGARHYLDRLRSGTSKLEIVRILRYSPEGRQAGVRIRGLRVSSMLKKVSRWPVLGRAVRAWEDSAAEPVWCEKRQRWCVNKNCV